MSSLVGDESASNCNFGPTVLTAACEQNNVEEMDDVRSWFRHPGHSAGKTRGAGGDSTAGLDADRIAVLRDTQKKMEGAFENGVTLVGEKSSDIVPLRILGQRLPHVRYGHGLAYADKIGRYLWTSPITHDVVPASVEQNLEGMYLFHK
ncbi:hypothetical protein CF326_g4047 [Tilletia indica]|nr:hypothetical protein CF326_g4047 [Tilletia indica]